MTATVQRRASQRQQRQQRQRPAAASVALLALALALSAGAAVGFTFAPCYAALCPEEYLPFETRMHVAFFYGLLLTTAAALLLRSACPPVLRASRAHVVFAVPALAGNNRVRVSAGAVVLALWTVGLTIATTGFWYAPARAFWESRMAADGGRGPSPNPEAASPVVEQTFMGSPKVSLVVTTIIGHHVDVVFGLLLIPVGRRSLVGRAFALHQATLLLAHKLLAWVTIVAAAAHGIAYYTFVGAYGNAPESAKDAFDVDDPTRNHAETDARPWSRAALPTGMLTFLAMLGLAATSLAAVRRASYNAFYYTHVCGAALAFVAACVHASTDFYFLLPGLALWVVDWALRLVGSGGGGGGDAEASSSLDPEKGASSSSSLESSDGYTRGTSAAAATVDRDAPVARRGLATQVTATLEDAGGGWFRLRLPPAASASSVIPQDAPAAAHPIQSYYLNVPSVSRLQNHAFTAADPGSGSGSGAGSSAPARGPVFLFQRAHGGKKQAQLEREWTWKLAALAVDSSSSSGDGSDDTDDPLQPPPPSPQSQKPAHHHHPVQISVRAEGPYTPAGPGRGQRGVDFRTAQTVFCVVGGTGITGALSLANWWLTQRRRQRPTAAASSPSSSPSAAAAAAPVFRLVWTVRHRATATALREWTDLLERARRLAQCSSSGDGEEEEGAGGEKETDFSAQLHVSSESGGRLRAADALRGALARKGGRGSSAWVYASGPAGLLGDAEDACLALRKEIQSSSSSGDAMLPAQLEWYLAKWEV